MRPWETIEEARAPDGTLLELARRGDEWVVRAGGRVLMSSRAHGSEEALAAAAFEIVRAPRDVLVGGLGLGFTLRAALDLLPAEARVRVCELLPELVAWNRAHVGALARQPLDDARCTVATGDVLRSLAPGAFDALLLDVDNGPSALAHPGNARLYDDAGVRRCFEALRSGGVLALWSAGPDRRYEERLRRAGFSVEVRAAPERAGSRSADVLFLAAR